MLFRIFLLVLLVAFGGDGHAKSKADRGDDIARYLEEFCGFSESTHTYAAIRNVLFKVSDQVFERVTSMRRPVIFVDTGSSPHASSQEFYMTPGKTCCEEGFTLIKLGGVLEASGDVGAIEGVVAHELAHRILDHIKNNRVSRAWEREANGLVKAWGFSQEFQSAREHFGHRKGDPAACQE